MGQKNKAEKAPVACGVSMRFDTATPKPPHEGQSSHLLANPLFAKGTSEVTYMICMRVVMIKTGTREMRLSGGGPSLILAE